MFVKPQGETQWFLVRNTETHSCVCVQVNSQDTFHFQLIKID